MLINSVLSSLPMFMLSFFEVPRGVLKNIEHFRSRFFWQNDQHRKKYRLAKWDVLCQPKQQGGLGIMNLDIQNKCLLSKWLFKLCNEEGIRQEILRNKYLRNKPLRQVYKKLGDSQFWKGLMGMKEEFLKLGNFKVHSGEHVWKQDEKHATVADVFSAIPLNISFRRSLVSNKLLEWRNLIARIVQVNLNEGIYVFI